MVKKSFAYFGLLVCMFLLLSGCVGNSSQVPNIETGSVTITIDKANTSQLDLASFNTDVTPVKIEVILVASNSTEFRKEMDITDEASVSFQFSEIPIGTATITVNAIDIDGYTIYSGANTVLIEPNKESTSTIDLTLCSSDVQFNITFPSSWEVSSGELTIIDIITGDKTAQLTITDHTATALLEDLKPGIWPLIIILYDASSSPILESYDEQITVLPGRTITANIEIVDTTGSLSIDVNWSLPPYIPTNVAPELARDYVTIYWEIEPGYNPIGYMVYRSETEQGKKTLLTRSSMAASEFYVDETVEAGKTYWYWVQSVGEGGLNSDFSAPGTIEVPLPSLTWSKAYGGTYSDQASSIAATDDGGCIIAGISGSYSGDISDNNGLDDVWIIRMDAYGDIVWEENYGGSSIDGAYGVFETIDGNIIVTGYTESDNYDVSYHGNDRDNWILKLSSTGTLLWEEAPGYSYEDTGYSIIETSNGDYISVGTTGYPYTEINGLAVKLANDGSERWKNYYRFPALGGTINYAHSIQETSDGGYIVSGETYVPTGAETLMEYDAWVFKLDYDGNLIWQKQFGGSGEDRGKSIKQTPDNGFIMAGYSNSSDINGLSNNGGYDFWVVKLDQDGNVEWQKTYGGSSHDYAYSIELTDDDGYIIAGKTYSTGGDVSSNHGNFDGWIIKLDSVGNLLWEKCYGGSSSDSLYEIVKTADGMYAAAGTTRSFDGDITYKNLESDYWILKIGPTGEY